MASLSLTVVQATRGLGRLNLAELWQYRELLYFLVWRDVKVRYKQTVLGVLWAVLQPMAAMVIFALFLGKLAKMPSDGAPYPLFAYAGLLPWMFFANALSHSSTSLVGSQRLITRVYFPRLLIPLSAAVSGLLDFAIAFLGFVGLLLYYGVTPSVRLLIIPLLLGAMIVTVFAVGLWLSALHASYRDVSYVLPFFIQCWMFASPVVYPASVVPEAYRTLYALNPMASLVEWFRWALLGLGQPPPWGTGVSMLIVLMLLMGGLLYFCRMERTVADVL